MSSGVTLPAVGVTSAFRRSQDTLILSRQLAACPVYDGVRFRAGTARARAGLARSASGYPPRRSACNRPKSALDLRPSALAWRSPGAAVEREEYAPRPRTQGSQGPAARRPSSTFFASL